MRLYCNTVYKTVLQEKASKLGNCIAIHRIVLQAGRWLDCIAAWGRNCIAEVQLYCNTMECSGFKIVLQFSLVGKKSVLYCNTLLEDCNTRNYYNSLPLEDPWVINEKV